jgi:sialate O-acetylesterase
MKMRCKTVVSVSALALLGWIPSIAQPPQSPPQQNSPQPFVSPVFADHMVLQRGKPNPIWGWSEPGDTVRVQIGEHTATATAGADGKWTAKIDPPEAGGPYTIQISGKRTVELQDVLVGDVWICAGQSNMQFGLGQARNGAEEVKNANYPQIRFYNVGERDSYSPADVPRGGPWRVITPEGLGGRGGGLSAAAYFFGRKVFQSVRVPIGLMQVAVGGVPAETFASVAALRPLGDFDDRIAFFQRLRQRGGREYGNYIMPWYEDYDIGQKNGSWADAGLDDSAWKTVQLPGDFMELGVAGVPSLTYLRKEVTIPDPVPQGRASIYLGQVEKMDTVYVNGRQVGSSSWVENPRVYGAMGLKPGKNVITIRLFRVQAQGGGFLDGADSMKLVLGDGTSIPLAGEWKGKVSVDGHTPGVLPPGYESVTSMVSVLYNGMLAPIAPMAIKGAIWYQGESNAQRAYQYRKLLPAMIADWRKLFGQGDFPFYIVGLPAYMHHKDNPGDDSWAEFREAQAMVAKSVPDSCLATTVDTGNPDNIHPIDKLQVGERLAFCALANSYGQKIPYSGPTLASVENMAGGAMKIHFDHTDGGLVVKGDKPGEFSVAGADRKWYWADARIEGDTIIVSSPSVPNPLAVRYAWQSFPTATMYNGAGLPAVPFRTDDWPGVTFGKTIY